MIRGVSPDRILSWQWEGFVATPLLWDNSGPFSLPQFPVNNIDLSEEFSGKIDISPRLILGKRAEVFFQYYLLKYSQEEILAFNEQISSEKITIGEVDFLLRNKETGTFTHVELVYKFYLYDPSFESEEDRWIGPNRKDTLLRKIRRIKEHQFPLVFRKESKPLLDRLGVTPEELHQKVCFKGNLFVPYELRNRTFPLLNNKCIRGYWMKFSNFNEDIFGKFQFYSPKKQNWPVNPSHGTLWHSYTEIIEQITLFVESQKSPLVWVKKNEKEYLRIFLVWW